MKDTKLPFKEYTVMSNNLIQNLNCSDVYRTYTLLLTADKDSLETNTTLKQLAGFVGEELIITRRVRVHYPSMTN